MGFGVITHNFDVYRLTKTGNNTEYSGTASVENLDCAVFPASTEILAVYPELPAYSTYEVFVYESAELKNGDKLTTAAGEEYIIRGVPQVYDTNYMYYQRLVAEKVI